MIRTILAAPLTGILAICIASVLWFVGKGAGLLLTSLAKVAFG